jgi:MATE family multidrug resistance protein
MAARYLAGLTWSMIPAWCFIAFRNFMGSLNHPEPALAITLAAIPVNGLLAYALIHGALGLPRLDLLGAGLATTFVNTAIAPAQSGFATPADRSRSIACSAASGMRTGS